MMDTLPVHVAERFRQVIAWFVSGDFQSIESRSRGVRLSADEMQRAIADYGRTLIMPPDSAFSHVNAIRVSVTSQPTWSVRFDFWTKEEGRSDLSLECTIIDRGSESLNIEIDNIHVL
jgi:hypothetical protein